MNCSSGCSVVSYFNLLAVLSVSCALVNRLYILQTKNSVVFSLLHFYTLSPDMSKKTMATSRN